MQGIELHFIGLNADYPVISVRGRQKKWIPTVKALVNKALVARSKYEQYDHRDSAEAEGN